MLEEQTDLFYSKLRVQEVISHSSEGLRIFLFELLQDITVAIYIT